MSLFRGDGTVSGVFVGDRAASAVYLGGTLVWPTVEPEIERPLITEAVEIGDGNPIISFACCINGSGTRLFITGVDAANKWFLLVLSTRSLSVVNRIELPITEIMQTPVQVIAVNDGELVYLQTATGSVLRVDVSDGTVEEVFTSSQIGLWCRLSAHPDGNRVYAYSNRKVIVIDVESGGYEEVSVPAKPGAVVLDSGIRTPEGSDPYYLLAAGTVFEMDTGFNSFVNEIGPPTLSDTQDGFRAVSLIPLSETLYCLGASGSSFRTDTVRVIDYYGNEFGDIDVDYKSPENAMGLFFRDLLFTTANEQTVFLFQLGLQRVSAIKAETQEIVRTWSIPEPRFLVVHPSGDRFYLTDSYGRLHVFPFVEDEVVEPEPDPDGPEPEPPTEILSIFGAGSSTYLIPDWAQELDVVVLGGGGGGTQGGAGFAAGPGGGAGSWKAVTWKAGTDFTPGTSVNVVVGAGGKGGANGTVIPNKGQDGRASLVSFIGPNGTRNVSAAGGLGNSSPNQWGASPGKYVFAGSTYQGGVTNAVSSAPGGVPGAGGSGSNGVAFVVGKNAGDGGYGRVWIRAYRNTRQSDRSARSMRGGVFPPFKGWEGTENGFART